MSTELNQKIIAKYLEDREAIKAMKKRHAEELRTLEEFQSKREAALLERVIEFDMDVFAFFTDLFVNGRDGKAEAEKNKASISMDQASIEKWLSGMLGKSGVGVKTTSGTVFKTRREIVSCGDFELFVRENMVKGVVEAVIDRVRLGGVECWPDGTIRSIGVTSDELTTLIMSNLHLELLNKAIAKAAVLELMGEQDPKDHSRPNPPPAGANYVAIQTVGVRKN